MPNGAIRSVTAIDDLVRGVTFFGTGGGGRPEDGRRHLVSCLEQGIDIQWVDVSHVPNDAVACTVLGMGSIAPVEQREDAPYGLADRVVSHPMVEAVRQLEQHAGVRISVVCPFELGGSNTPKAIDAALRLGALVPDGDLCGRAVPELGQVVPAIAGISPYPVSICDDWGNVMILKAAATLDAAEAIGKAISGITKAPDVGATCAHAAFLMMGADLKKTLVPGTLTRSVSLGAAIRKALARGEDPVEAAASASGGTCVARGSVTAVEWVNEHGYMTGTTRISGAGRHQGKSFEIWFRNENHLLTCEGQPLAMSPDMIHVVQEHTGEPITNTRMERGLHVGVIVSPNLPYRAPGFLRALGPRHFGLDVDYFPFRE